MSTPVNTDFRGSGREVVAHEQQRTSRPLAPCGWAAAPVRALASRRGSQHLIRLHSRSAPHPEDRPSAVSGSRTGQGWRRSRVFRERRRRRTRCHSGLPGSPRAAGNRPPKTMPVLALFAGHSRVHDAETTADRGPSAAATGSGPGVAGSGSPRAAHRRRCGRRRDRAGLSRGAVRGRSSAPANEHACLYVEATVHEIAATGPEKTITANWVSGGVASRFPAAAPHACRCHRRPWPGR